MRIDTEIYRALARVVARRLGRAESVLSVYARRSVAAGAVVLGRSDIDLHVIVARPSTLEEEAELLLDLSERFRRIKAVVPVLGHFDVSTREELERWYREQPFHRFRDRGWLRLYGEAFERPRGAIDGPARSRVLWWYFWAAQQLPHNFRVGNARTCFNLVLDMFDAYRLFTGESGSLSRAELVRAWFDSGPSTEDRAAIVRASGRGFRAHRGAALEPLYRESLALHGRLSARVRDRVAASASGTVASRVPPAFDARTYLLVDPASEDAVQRGLQAMRRDESVWLVTEEALQLYLFHRNPWECATLSAADGDLELAQPPEAAFEQAVRFSLYREIPRHYGMLGHVGHIGPLYSQARLYADESFVASAAGELQDAYRERYGTTLTTAGPRERYFRHEYPPVCRVIDELRERL
jgi:predicted nucleotidyltransferase